MGERVMVFVDGSNLYHSLKNHFKRTDLDLGRFCQKLLRRRQLIRICFNAVEESQSSINSSRLSSTALKPYPIPSLDWDGWSIPTGPACRPTKKAPTFSSLRT